MIENVSPSPIDWQGLTALVASHRRYVLTTHVRPDGDALGSELGLALILESLGKEVRIVNAHATPAHLAFLDPQGRILVLGRDLSAAQAADADVLWVLDTSAWNQLGSMADVLRATAAVKVVLDHHRSADDLGAREFKDPTAEATGRLVIEAAGHLGVPLTEGMAFPLLAAVATDTGWFRFASTTAETFRVTAQLVEAGAQPAALYQALYERNSAARLHLLARILARTTIECQGRFVHSFVAADDFAATGAVPSDTEDAINLTLTIDGSQVAVLLVEQADGLVKASFRSRAAVDVSALAESFGGGGHRAASGATLPGPLDAARRRVLDAVRAELR